MGYEVESQVQKLSQTEHIGSVLFTFVHDPSRVFDNKLRQPNQFVHIFKWVEEKFQTIHHMFKLRQGNVLLEAELQSFEFLALVLFLENSSATSSEKRLDNGGTVVLSPEFLSDSTNLAEIKHYISDCLKHTSLF